jgi:WD40 repeat protein
MTRVLAGVAIAGTMAFAASCATSSPSVPPSSPNATSAGASPSSSAASGGPSLAPSKVPYVPAGQLVFDRFDATAGAEGPYLGTFIANGGENGERKLTVPVQVDQLMPAWSPDARRLLVNISHPPPGLGDPAFINADGSGYSLVRPKGLTESIGCSDWSPDGRTLVCSIGSGEHHQLDGIYTIRVDGSHLTRLTHSPYHDTVGSAGECGGGENRAVYSPNGTRIAYIRQKCGTGPDPSSDESAAIEVMSVDGRDVHEIVPQGGVKSHPGSQLSWSPDGSQIALGSQDGRLLLVHPDGSAYAQIALPADLGDYHAWGPDWSPDGTRLVFSMYLASSDSTDLYAISPDGSNLVRITHVPGSESGARWGPAAS